MALTEEIVQANNVDCETIQMDFKNLPKQAPYDPGPLLKPACTPFTKFALVRLIFNLRFLN